MSGETIVSIITPNYNCSDFIAQAIESVIAQTYQYWEMLIIDDCSTDNSIAVIEKYVQQDARIKLLRTGCNSGSPVEPRNRGIQNAQGRYIAFLDSDDLWLPDKLERQLPLFNDDNTAIVYSNYKKIAATGKRRNRIVKAPERLTYKQLLKSNYIGCLTAIYDTTKPGKVYFNNNFRHEDYVFWLTILQAGYIAVNANSLSALYRVRENSISAGKWTVLKWQWVIYRDFLKLPLIYSIYYFCFYAVNAFAKYIK